MFYPQTQSWQIVCCIDVQNNYSRKFCSRCFPHWEVGKWSASYSNIINLFFLLYSIHFTITWVAIFKGPTESPSAILSSISGNDHTWSHNRARPRLKVSMMTF